MGSLSLGEEDPQMTIKTGITSRSFFNAEEKESKVKTVIRSI